MVTVIDVSSSSETEASNRTPLRRSKRSRTPSQPPESSGSGSKASTRRNANGDNSQSGPSRSRRKAALPIVPEEVIELTDSDSESNAAPRMAPVAAPKSIPPQSIRRQANSAGMSVMNNHLRLASSSSAGPSRPIRSQIRHSPLDDAEPVPPKRGTHMNPSSSRPPLFLPQDSDDENILGLPSGYLTPSPRKNGEVQFEDILPENFPIPRAESSRRMTRSLTRTPTKRRRLPRVDSSPGEVFDFFPHATAYHELAPMDVDPVGPLRSPSPDLISQIPPTSGLLPASPAPDDLFAPTLWTFWHDDNAASPRPLTLSPVGEARATQEDLPVAGPSTAEALPEDPPALPTVAVDDIIASCMRQVKDIIPDIDETFLREQVMVEIRPRVGVVTSINLNHPVLDTDYWDDDFTVPPQALFTGGDEELPLEVENGEEIGRVVVEALMNKFFENPTFVVKNKGKGKGVSRDAGPSGSQKRSDAGDGEEQGKVKRMKVDWLDAKSRVGPRSGVYDVLCRHHLFRSFPDISKNVVLQALKQKRGLYAPTHFYLLELSQKPEGEGLGLSSTATKRKRKRTRTAIKGKGKARAVNSDNEEDEEVGQSPPPNRIVEGVLQLDERDELFEEERLWVTEEQARRDKVVAEEVNAEEHEDAGAKIECGCCFDEFPFDQMVQCPEAHLFCMNCITQLSSTSIVTPMGPAASSSSTGVAALVVCPAIGDTPCNLPFTASELKRALPDTLYQKWERECQRRELDAAEIDEMEECPFCDYRCIIAPTFEEEKLFRCGNEEGGCGVVSCRKCKKPDHLPKTCDEVSEDTVLEGRHVIEEAMSKALMRNCPKCKKPFIKELGCNKMTCPHCHTLSCYVCRQIVTGYEHFGRGKCQLHDNPTGYDHDKEVEQARTNAIQAYRRDNPEANIEDIDKGIVKGPEPAPVRSAAMQRAMAWGGFLGAHPPYAGPAFGGLAAQPPPHAVFGLPPPLQRMFPPPLMPMAPLQAPMQMQMQMPALPQVHVQIHHHGHAQAQAQARAAQVQAQAQAHAQAVQAQAQAHAQAVQAQAHAHAQAVHAQARVRLEARIRAQELAINTQDAAARQRLERVRQGMELELERQRRDNRVHGRRRRARNR